MNNILRSVFGVKKKKVESYTPKFRTVYPSDMPKTENDWYRHLYNEINKQNHENRVSSRTR